MTPTTKPFPWRCGACRERAVAPAVLASYEANLDHDGKTYRVELRDLPVLRCGHCGEVVFGDEAFAREIGCARAVVYATPEAAGFYAAVGYAEDEFDDNYFGGVVQMAKATSPREVDERIVIRTCRAAAAVASVG